MKIADWLFDQVEFDETVRSKGVRFLGLCDQSIVKFDVFGLDGQRAKGLKPQFKLPLHPDFPVETVQVIFDILPKEAPPEDHRLYEIYSKSHMSLLSSSQFVIEVSFQISERLLEFVHEGLTPYFRIDPRKPRQDHERRVWAYQFAVRNIAVFIARHIAVCANITKAGGLALGEGIVFIGDEKFDARSYHSPIASIQNIETERGIKLLRELDFLKAWEFYSNLKGTLVGSPESEIEIAVSNFTDLFDDTFDQSGARNLIWGFAGLEAILADGEASVGSQLRQKLVALFGNQVDVSGFEKEIVDIYRYRSKIIHGKAKSRSSLKNLSADFFTSTDEGKESRVAIWLLLAVLQYCFQNKQSVPKFKTVVI